MDEELRAKLLDSQNQHKVLAYSMIPRLALLGLSAGAAWRALRGARGLVERSAAPEPKLPIREAIVPLMIPASRKPEPRPTDASVQRRAQPFKAAGAEPASWLKDPITALTQRVGDAAGMLHDPKNPAGRGLAGMLWGDSATSKSDMPLLWPLGGAALGLGLYGGYRGMGAALDRARQHERDSELDAARRRYEEEIAAALPAKTAEAAVPRLSAATAAKLDEIYDRIEASGAEKTAMLGALLGAMMLGGGLSATAAGLGTYNFMTKADEGRQFLNGPLERAALEKALRRRQQALFAGDAVPIVLVPRMAPQRPALERKENQA